MTPDAASRMAGLWLATTVVMSGPATAAGSPASPITPPASPAASHEPASSSGPTAKPGGRSAGDPFYPTLGNTGYDVRSYDLSLAWTPPANDPDDGTLDAVAVIDGVATQDLAELSLDLTRANTTVARVTLDAEVLEPLSDVAGRKLVLRPSRPLAAGTSFTLSVAYSARPLAVTRTGEGTPLPSPGDSAGIFAAQARGFIADGNGGFFLAAQPNGAHTLFPSNDHPTDKALLTVRLTSPPGMLGVATGAQTSTTAGPGGTVTSVFASAHPVATHVVAIAIGRLTILSRTGLGGLPLRYAVPSDLVPLADDRLTGIPDVLAWLESLLGSYPFETFGIAFTPGEASDAALEGQTLVVMTGGVFDPRIPRCKWLGTVAHEISHQWFGDSVSLTRWDEKWLSEGHATYYQRLWEARHDCDARTFDEMMRDAYAAAQGIRDAGGPPAAPRDPSFAYDATIYDQGALVLDALRAQVGRKTFAAIESTWLSRFADSSASTAAFIDLASDVAGEDLGPFLRAWLYAPTVPPMPGHPEWTTGASTPSASPPPSPAPLPSQGAGAILLGLT